MGNSISKDACENINRRNICSCQWISTDCCANLINNYSLQTEIKQDTTENKPTQIIDANYMKRMYY